MKKRFCLIMMLLTTICLFTACNNKISNSYSSGSYQIGTEMPAGEYHITSTSSQLSTVHVYENNSKDAQIVAQVDYLNRVYITVTDGEYLKFNGTASPSDEASAYYSADGIYEAGMYKVGKDIPSGLYLFSVYAENDTTDYDVYSDSFGNILTTEKVDPPIYQSLEDGQYINFSGKVNTSNRQASDYTNTSFQSGMYKIGVDMPAGEYLIAETPTDSQDVATFVTVYNNATETTDAIYGGFPLFNRTYITVANGQYLQFEGTATPTDDVPSYKAVDGVYQAGFYKVGKDIPAGEYKFSAKPNCCYQLYSNSLGRIEALVAGENISSDTVQSLTNGQYVYFNGTVKIDAQ